MRRRTQFLKIPLVLAIGFGLYNILNWEYDDGKFGDDKIIVKEQHANPDVAKAITRLMYTGADGSILDGGETHVTKEFLKAQENLNKVRTQQAELNWIERGPSNISGRTRCIVVDATDNQGATWVVGTAGGGIWRSTDEGVTWTNVTPDLPNLSVVTVAQSASNSSIWYAGTGEGGLQGTTSNGYGVLKSTDGGLTWSLLENTTPLVSNDFWNVNRLIIDPADENTVLAATSNGFNGQEFRSAVMKTTDGGTTWTTIYSPNSRAQQILADPADFNTLYVSLIGRGMAKSTDGGATWNITGLADAAGSFGPNRSELSISPADNNNIFASVGYVNRSGAGLYFSNDKGETWNLVKDSNEELDVDYLIQGEFNNCIVAHPTNKNIVYWGGTELWTATIIEGNIIQGDRDYLGTVEDGTGDFLSFVSFNNGTHFNNSIAINDPQNTPSIEIRFGSGVGQKAHRFTVPAGSTSGVPDNDYSYVDYVDVPFEVWNTDTNTQLMVSFRDQQDDGVFNLNEANNDQEEANNREYLFIHSINYNASQPSSTITTNGGQEQSQYMFIWPTLTIGGVWDANNLPTSKLAINFGNQVFQNSTITSIASNGGANGGKVHVDHHNLMIDPDRGSPFRLFTNNDGGLAITDNAGVSFEERESGLNVTQFYNATKQPGTKVYIGGTQDNEVLKSIEDPDFRGFYTPQSAGAVADGFEVAWNGTNTSMALGSNQRNNIFKTEDGGLTWTDAVTGLDDAGFNDTAAPFFTKIGYSANAANTAFAVSATGVWRSTNFGDNWTSVPIANNWGGFLDVEVSDANANIVWAGGGMSSSLDLYVSTDRGVSFSAVNDFADLGNISTIVPSPNDANTAYVTFSQQGQSKILRTTDLGQTWVDLTQFENGESQNGYPDVATLVVLPFPDGQTIWAGTEIGLVESTDGGATWNFANNGMPNVYIWDMKVVDGEIVVATHGRGIWTVDLGLEYTNQVIVLSADDINEDIQFYPNPFTDQIRFNAPNAGIGSVRIYDNAGKVVFETNSIDNGSVINTSDYNPGVYYIKYETPDGVETQKMIKAN